MQGRGKRGGTSGRSRATPRSPSKQRGWRWRRRPGPEKIRGRLAGGRRVTGLTRREGRGWGGVGRPAAVGTPKSAGGGRQWTVHNWWPMSYNAQTGLVYIPTTDRRADAKAAVESGESGAGLEGRLIAWDPLSQSARWSVEEQIATNGGVLSTAGNLVFQGQGTGEFAAFAADSGRRLWAIKTGSAIACSPVSVSVKGEQYVITAVGWGSGSRLFAPARTMVTPESARGPVRLLAFKLGATAAYPVPPVVIPPVPEPPKQN